MSGATDIVLALVAAERERQEVLKRSGRFKHTCADTGLTDAQKLCILTEELGEVARAVQEAADTAGDKHGKDLMEELVQVAAVAVAWVEGVMKAGRAE